MAPPLPPAFVGRGQAGSLLVQALATHRSAMPIVITGPPGFGKSTIAAWACHQVHVQERFPDGVLWVRLSARPDAEEQVKAELVEILTDLITRLVGKDATYRSVPVAADAFAAALGDRRVLIVIDGVWRTNQVEPFLAGGLRCVRLVTTQRSTVVSGHEIPVPPMTSGEAAALLGRGLPGSSGERLAPLLGRAGGCPLAIDPLNGVLRSLRGRLGLSLPEAISELAAKLDRQGLSMLAEFADRDEMRVGSTFAVSLRELAATAPDKRETLDRYAQLCAFPNGALIPYRWLARLWGFDAVQMAAEFKGYLDRSLATSADRDGVRLHDVFHDQLRRDFPDAAREASRKLLGLFRPGEGWHALRGHFNKDLRNQLAHHLVQAGRDDELATLLRDFRYLAARIHEDGPVALESDLAACSEASADEYAGQLLDLVRKDAHLLAGHESNEADIALTLYSRICGWPQIEHVDEALPDFGLVPEQPLPDRAAPHLARSLTGHQGQVSFVAWQADGLLVSIGGDDGTLRHWNQETGAQEAEQRICTDALLKAWRSPDERHVALCALIKPQRESRLPESTLARIVVISVGAGSIVAERPVSARDLIDGSRMRVAWSPDSAVLAIAAGAEIEFWWPFEPQRPCAARKVDPSAYARFAYALDWHPAGGLACLTSDGCLITWHDPISSDHADSRRVLHGESPPRALAWNPDGTRVALAADHHLSVVGVGPSGEDWEGMPRGLGCPAEIAWRPDGHAFAVIANDSQLFLGSAVTIWDASPRQRTYSVVDTRYSGVVDVAWQPSGEHLAVAYTDSTVRVWQPASERCFGSDDDAPVPDRREHPVHWAVHAVADGERAKPAVYQLPDSGILATRYDIAAEPGETPRVVGRRPHPGSVFTAAAGPRNAVQVATSPGSGFHVTAEWDRHIEYVMSSTQACQDFGMPQSVAVHTFGFPDIELTLRRITDGQVIKRISWRAPRCLAVDPVGHYIATGSETGAIMLIGTQNLDRVCQVRLDEAVQACVFDPTGQRLAVAGSSGIYLFRVRR
jgi:WD40 repeat protein